LIDVLDAIGPINLALIPFLLIVVISIAMMSASKAILSSQAKNQSQVEDEIFTKAELLVKTILPSSRWLPIFIKVVPSTEIFVRLHSHFFHLSTAAIQELTHHELAFLLKSEYNFAKVMQRKYMWISFIPAVSSFFPLMLIILSGEHTFLWPTVIASSLLVTPVMLLTSKWARKDAERWRSLADELTVAEIPQPRAAATAVQKSIGSVVEDSKQTPYQRSMARLEVVENAARQRVL